jgi:hypothetical protein
MALPQERQRDEVSCSAPRVTGAAFLARFYWVLAGNAIAGFLAVSIALHGHAVSWRDLAYGAAVASMIAVRFVDVTRLSGTTADGAPATLSAWRRYAIMLLLVCAGVWMGAHGIAFVLE